MVSLNVYSLFNNIPLEETIEICANEILSLATKDSHFIFNGTLYKQIDCVDMGSLLGPSLANGFPFRPFLAYHKRNWLERCPP